MELNEAQRSLLLLSGGRRLLQTTALRGFGLIDVKWNLLLIHSKDQSKTSQRPNQRQIIPAEPVWR